MKAAIFHEAHKPLTIENVEIDTPIGREVLVRTVASGVCHSDLHFVDGYYPFPTPAILGHEAAGIVEAVGPQVGEFKPGDHVIACLSVFCGACDYCLTGKTHLCQTRPARKKDEPPKLRWNGQPVNQCANLSAYAEKMLVHVNARADDPVKAIRTLTNGGVAYSFAAIGLKIAAEQCFDCLKPGGTATVIGMIPVGQKIELDGPMFLREKKIQGCSMGSNRFKVDMPRYIEFYRQGRLKLDEMVSRRGKLEDVNEAFRAMKAGEVARTVLMFD